MWRDRGVQHKEAFRSLEAAKEAKGKRDTGETQPVSNKRFDDYAERWLETYKGCTEDEDISPTTRAGYERAIRQHAIPHFRSMRMKDIYPREVREFIKHMRDGGAKPPSVRNHMVAVKLLFATAHEDGDISSNPTQSLRKRKARSATQPKAKAMTRVELRLVLAALPAQWRPFFTFLGQTGLRISEAIGLRWEDVELGSKRPHVKVRRQIYKGVERELKSAKSEREVPLTPGMVASLLELRGKRYGGPHAPVWSTQHGRPLDAHNVRNRVLRPVATELGLPWVGFHTFRHTCATLLFAGGKDVVQVQTWLGHADPAFTLRTYISLKDEGVGSADFLDDALDGGNAVATQHPETAKSPATP